MESSPLSAIFMDNPLPPPWIEPSENTEDLKHLLICASMELESARAAAQAQGKLHEARVRHLEELLKATRKERDEALDQCLKLQHRIVSSNATPHMISELSAMVPLQAFGESSTERESLSCNYTLSSTGLLQIDNISSEVQWKLQDLQALQSQQEQAHNFSSQVVLEELGLQVEPSSNASSHLASPISLDNVSPFDLDVQTAIQDSTMELQHSQEWAASLEQQPFLPSFPSTGVPSSPAISISTIEASNSAFVQCPQISPASAISTRPPLLQNPMHLPEPPEADLQVMLKSLPEKGKLLQAVLQAGPLLQTLLLAGPLPKWRHPPPALEAVDIPRISTASPPITQPFCSFRPSHSHMSTLGNDANASAGATTRISNPVQYSSPMGLCSTSKRLRSQSYPDIRLIGAPFKYAKIY